ncbi:MULTISPECIES: rhombosortase [Idiomarina]|uniref:rhombosortase n=1 Tax=Idiomarina TaxID=135575 RepID=UPI000C0B3EC5|nr:MULTISPECIES: rhombosortase [Idiomarina]MAL84313.1 rhombosortase [Idiomarina sp.]MBP58456.1 rhombosortase [Idiomarina sp.]MDA6065917.1 rhombosortase [Idiomarina abyssalis]QZN89901.1 rhombosortase [Idiomarina abyssalis]|tara:strand:- start:52543 stop:53112 length:570 start_codon:yes stop_codon:yes gene_type:complete
MERFNQYWAGLILVLLLSVFLQLMPHWHATLSFNSSTVMSEGWPLITTHFIHLDWWHALFNFIGLTLIVLIWREYWTTRWLINALLLSGTATALLLWLAPLNLSFVGLSGVLHGLLAYCLIKDIRSGKKWMWLILIALVAKVIAELLGWRPTHFVGEHVSYIHAAGLVSSLLLYKLERRRISDAVSRDE